MERSAELVGGPLDDGSLLWRYASDGRVMFAGAAAGLLQLMHPGLGAGVVEHSSFFTDPWGRILRSIPQIWGTILADDEIGAARGHAIRDLHRGIKGIDEHGDRYHALDPEVFWWAHATFTWMFLRAAELYYPRPLRAADRERLYAETITWYGRYGVSDRVVPGDLAAFEKKFDDICRNVLERTPAADRALRMAQTRRADGLVTAAAPPRPQAMQVVVANVGGRMLRLFTLGGLPGHLRRRFDVQWSRADRLGYVGVLSALRGTGLVFGPRHYERLMPPGTPTRWTPSPRSTLVGAPAH